GLTPPRGGAVRFKDRDITGHAPHEIFHLGIGYVPEGRQIFPHLEVGENLRLAERRVDGDSSWTRERIFTYFPVLRERWRPRGRAQGPLPLGIVAERVLALLPHYLPAGGRHRDNYPRQQTVDRMHKCAYSRLWGLE